VAHDGQEGSQMAAAQQYDLMILDWMLPQKSGLEICQERRSQGDITPVLFLTAKDTLDDRVAGLDAGADDYLIKPFELRELLARVRALLRRPPTLEPGSAEAVISEPSTTVTRLQVKDLELDLTNQLADRNGRKIELSEKESQLLAFFMRQPNQLLTHEQIYQAIWSDAEKPTSNVLAAQIRLLRRKIELAGETPLIQTVYGKGYRFDS
jgi:two-component system, OmpR family, manganese sensing response regulator